MDARVFKNPVFAAATNDILFYVYNMIIYMFSLKEKDNAQVTHTAHRVMCTNLSTGQQQNISLMLCLHTYICISDIHLYDINGLRVFKSAE